MALAWISFDPQQSDVRQFTNCKRIYYGVSEAKKDATNNAKTDPDQAMSLFGNVEVETVDLSSRFYLNHKPEITFSLLYFEL